MEQQPGWSTTYLGIAKKLYLARTTNDRSEAVQVVNSDLCSQGEDRSRKDFAILSSAGTEHAVGWSSCDSNSPVAVGDLAVSDWLA